MEAEFGRSAESGFRIESGLNPDWTWNPDFPVNPDCSGVGISPTFRIFPYNPDGMTNPDSNVLVSAIMPTTHARRAFIPLAIDCLRRQRISALELIVVSEDERARWCAIDAAESNGIEVRAFSCGRGTPVGTKRNIACAAAVRR